MNRDNKIQIKRTETYKTEDLKLPSLYDFYKDSIYGDFIKCSSIISKQFMKYMSPIPNKKYIICCMIQLEFGFCVYIQPSYFKSTSDSQSEIVLPFTKDYFMFPFGLIHKLYLKTDDKLLLINTKVRI